MISSAATTFCCIVLLGQTSQARKSDQGAYISLIIQIYVNTDINMISKCYFIRLEGENRYSSMLKLTNIIDCYILMKDKM